MTKFIAHISEEGELLGWYTKEIHKEIPKPNVTVDQEQWQDAINNSYNFYDKSDKKFKHKDFRSPEEIAETKAARLRIQRDSAIEAVAWLAERHQLEQAAETTTTLSKAEFTELLSYMQALRDVPQHKDFPNNSLPEKPAFIN